MHPLVPCYYLCRGSHCYSCRMSAFPPLLASSPGPGCKVSTRLCATHHDGNQRCYHRLASCRFPHSHCLEIAHGGKAKSVAHPIVQPLPNFNWYYNLSSHRGRPSSFRSTVPLAPRIFGDPRRSRGVQRSCFRLLRSGSGSQETALPVQQRRRQQQLG